VAEPLTLGERFVDEAHLPLLEVAESAVHELGRLGRGAGGEVVPLYEGRPQAPGGGVESAADPCDPTADHDHVEVHGGEAAERIGTIETGGQHGPHATGRI